MGGGTLVESGPNVLSTKRAARDFNMSVLHDLTFWMAWLSGETEGVFALRTEESNELAEFAPTIIVNSALPAIAFNSAAFQGGRIVDDELDEALSEVDDELQELVAMSDEYGDDESENGQDENEEEFDQ